MAVRNRIKAASERKVFQFFTWSTPTTLKSTESHTSAHRTTTRLVPSGGRLLLNLAIHPPPSISHPSTPLLYPSPSTCSALPGPDRKGRRPAA